VRRSPIEARAQVLDDGRQWLDPGCAQRCLEIRDESAAECDVSLGTLYERVELGARPRKLLRRAHPPGRSRWEQAEQLPEPLFVICRHTITCPLDAGATGFLPSSSSRSLPRQREILLAIVPAGRSSASPIVR
jgi:hypothetical protein